MKRQIYTQQNLKTLVWKWRGVLITTPAVTCIVLLLRLTGLLQYWEWATFDLYTRYKPSKPTEERVVIVGINEDDLREVGIALIPDQIYAQLLQKLTQMQPRAIGLLVYRDLPVPPGHAELIKTFQTTPNLVGIQKAVGDRQENAVAPPPLLEALQQVGASDLIKDKDHRIRRGLIYLNDSHGETIFSFGFRLALEYLSAIGIVTEVIPGSTDWRLGKQVFFPLEPNDGGYVRGDTNGYQVLLNYQGKKEQFDTVSLMDILNNRVSSDWGKDRIILIGPVSESFKDFFPTPYSSNQYNFPEQMPGVEIQAHFISQIIQAAMGEFPLIQTPSELLELIGLLFWTGIGAGITWTKRYYQNKSTIILKTSGIIAAGFVLVSFTYFAFLQGYWIRVIPPLLGLTGSALSITIYMDYKARLTRKTFGRYLTDKRVAQLLESKEGFQLGAKRQRLTILASDLRGFTAISERLKPEEVVQILNIYFRQMSKVITDYGGIINQLMGDGMLIFFNSIFSSEDHATRGVACAVAMQLEMEKVNCILNELGFPKLEMGIGLNTGDAAIGNIGSEERTEYTAIGCEVNLAFHIEACTTGGEIFISESLKQATLPTRLKLQKHKNITVKGFRESQKIYKILGIGQPYNLYLPVKKYRLLPLNYKLSIQYSILRDKQDSNFLYQGDIVRLSLDEAEIKLPPNPVIYLPETHTNIKLYLQQNNTYNSEGSYAKVIGSSKSKSTFKIRFTYRPHTTLTQLQTIYESLQVLNSVKSSLS
ncbi:MAG: adenylate/guanylate cyclase domain-containing protein [Microcoleaceae cyanobacterium]